MPSDIFIPLLTYPDADGSDAVDAVVAISKAFATGLTFTVFAVDIPNIAYSFGAEVIDVSGLVAEAEALSKATATSLIKHIRSIGGAVPITVHEMRMRQDQVTKSATAMAQSHDLSIVQLRSGASTQRQLVEDLTFGSGRPVLVMPGTIENDPTLETIAIGWDGGRAAARAVHDATDLLVSARSVILITAYDDKVIADGAVSGITAYLERRGVKASHCNTTSANKRIGVALQEAALENGADLLVMGAFGHNRLRDFVLGGATNSVLDHVMLPIYLSH